MANERRLIDAERLKRQIIAFASGLHADYLTIENIVMMINQADTLEFVYCKDCRWRDAEDDCLNPKCGKSWYGCPVSDEHYCSYGERRCVDERN